MLKKNSEEQIRITERRRTIKSVSPVKVAKATNTSKTVKNTHMLLGGGHISAGLSKIDTRKIFGPLDLDSKKIFFTTISYRVWVQ